MKKTAADIKELYDLLSQSNHWMIREQMNIYHIEENGAIHVFYEKEREFVNAEDKSLSIEVKYKEGYSYVSPHDQARCKAYGDDTNYYEDDRCDIYAFVNYHLTSHPDQADMDIVDSLICNIDGKEFSITPTPYPGLMYQDILNKSKVQERTVVLGNPDESINISY